jgi:2-amino-4-hydroxy-6-hydroxymethyldihydropteridine diphosphokinase
MRSRKRGIFNQFCRMMRRCLIGLGSNLGDRHSLLDEAIAEIAKRLKVRPVLSSRYETPAWGMAPGTPAFLNQVAVVESDVEPHGMLEELLAIERDLGRTRAVAATGYQSRSIDLDLLAVEGVEVNDERLTLPHPRMHLRRFVLEPLHEIAPEFQLRAHSPSVAELLQHCPDSSEVKRLEPTA